MVALSPLQISGDTTAQFAGVLPEDTPGVRPERDYSAGGAFGLGRGAQKLYHLGVAQVDSVEETCSGYNHFTNSKSWR